MPDRQYVYKITEVVKVTDGDTYWLRCDVGFRQTILINVRLHGYDCPETRSRSQRERAAAQFAKEEAEYFLTTTLPLYIHTMKDPDNFGRWLGDVWREDDEGDLHLGEWLHQNELATVWPTRWRDVYDVHGSDTISETDIQRHGYPHA